MNIQQIAEEIESLEIYRKFVDVTRSIAQVKELRVRALISRREPFWLAIQDAAYDSLEALRVTGEQNPEAAGHTQQCDPDGRWEQQCLSPSVSHPVAAAGAFPYADLQRCLAPMPSPSLAGQAPALIIVAGSNQGLCGDFHRKLMSSLERESAGAVLCLGRRTRNSVARMRLPHLTLVPRPVPGAGFADELSGLDSYPGGSTERVSGTAQTPPLHQPSTAHAVRLLAQTALAAFLNGRFMCAGLPEDGLPVSQVRIVYIEAADRETARTAVVRVRQVLPIETHLLAGRAEDCFGRRVLVEPSLSLGAAVLLPAYVESCIEHALLHSSRAEHAIRRQETTEASHSLEELIDQKSLEKRKARRERITRQLVELISAAEAYEEG